MSDDHAQTVPAGGSQAGHAETVPGPSLLGQFPSPLLQRGPSGREPEAEAG
jgi:hypothetical protein